MLDLPSQLYEGPQITFYCETVMVRETNELELMIAQQHNFFFDVLLTEVLTGLSEEPVNTEIGRNSIMECVYFW